MTTLTGTIQERVQLPPSARGLVPAGARLSAADVARMLRRRLVVLVTLFMLLLGLCLGGLAVWWRYFPGYRSECLIECVSNIPDSGLTIEQERLRQEEHERFVATEAVLIRQPSILETALRITAVRETRWYQDIVRRRLEPQLELREDLVAAPVRGTNFLRVALECRHREDPNIIVDHVVRVWLDSVKRRSTDVFGSELEDRRGELDSLERRIDDRRRQLQAIAARLPPGARQDPVNNVVAQEARQLAEQVAVLRLELSQLEQLRDIYNDPQGMVVSSEDRALVEQDPAVLEMRRQLFLLEQQRSADARKYGDAHAVLKQIAAQIAAAQDLLRELETQRLFEIQRSNREAANTAYANTQYALFLAQERLQRAEAALQDQDQLLFEYANLDADIERDIERRNQLLDYIQSLERVVRQRSAIDVRVAQPAVEPIERSSPSLLLVPVAVMLSLALSVGLVLGFETMDKRLLTPQDVIRHLDLPMLGVIPDSDDEEVNIKRVETVVRDAPQSMIAEAFRRLHTSLRFSAPAGSQRAVLITSPKPEDGKTTVAINLATCIAGGGRRVLLVDANFRRPRIREIFPTVGGKGLSDILVGNARLDECVGTSAAPLLDALSSGPTPPNPAELLGGEPFRAFLHDACGRYDQVIIDSAPVLVASDALVLSSLIDGVVLVVRARRDSRGVARRAATLLTDVNARLIGAVLNAARVTRGGYFREELRTYYEYHGEEAAPPANQGQSPSPRTT